MGAGVAAGPHCPVASNPAWEARRSALGGFEKSAPEPGAPLPFPAGVHPRPKPFPGFPAGSPTRAEALAVRRLAVWNSRSASRLRGSGRPEPSVPQPAGSSAEALGPPGGPWTEVLGPPLRSSRAETRSCPTDPGRNPFPPVGDALTEIPLSAGLVLDPKVRCPACRFLEPEGSRFRWALHEACRFRIR